VPTAEILKSAGIKTDERDYVVVNDEMKTNVAGVYAAGDCTGKSHQIIVAVGQGSTAGINASAFVKG
jgi:thioredoxin reductase (NADPH)